MASTLYTPHQCENELRPGTQVHFHRTSLLGGFEVLHALYLNQSFARHWHEEQVFGVVDSGAEQLEYRGRTYVAPTNSLLMLTSGEAHTGEPASPDGWGFRLFYLPSPVLEGLAREADVKLSGPLFFPEVIATDTALAQQLVLLHETLLGEVDGAGDTLADESIMVQVFTQLLKQYAENVPGNGPEQEATPLNMAAAREFLEAYFTRDISLSDLAALAGTSRFHFLRQFHQHYGMPPHAMQVQLRIHYVQRLLREGVTAAKAAQLAGFADPSHLNRHFKRHVGVTPGQFAAH
jgi:AraC-like DNA-binding protein